MKLPQAIATLGAAIDADIPVHLWGAPGIGKSEAVAAVAKARGADFYDIRLNLFDPVDLRGLPTIVDGKTVWLRPAVWPTDSSRETVLMFDEMDRASPSVMSAAMQIVLDRRIGEHRLPDSVRIVAAGNGKTDRTGTNKMPSALANRFCHIDIEPDADAWAAWATGAGIHPSLVAFIRFRPDLIHQSTMRDGNRPIEIDPNARSFPSPRAWAKIDKIMRQPKEIRHALASGLVGATPAAEFAAYIDVIERLPPIATLLADPTGAPVPSEPSHLYAVSTALARKATDSNFAAVLTYAARMPREFDIITAVDAVKRQPALAQTGAFVSWAARNSEVTI